MAAPAPTSSIVQRVWNFRNVLRDDGVSCGQGRWRAYTYDELLDRDKVSLDIFWFRDESLEDSASLPEPDVLAAEIVQDLQAALEQFAAIAEDLGPEDAAP